MTSIPMKLRGGGTGHLLPGKLKHYHPPQINDKIPMRLRGGVAALLAGGLIYKSNASNMQRTTSMSFLALGYAKYLSDVSKAAWCENVEATPARLRAFAKRQIDYILRENPLNLSYMVGYGSRSPQQILHRASTLPSIVVHPDFVDFIQQRLQS